MNVSFNPFFGVSENEVVSDESDDSVGLPDFFSNLPNEVDYEEFSKYIKGDKINTKTITTNQIVSVQNSKGNEWISSIEVGDCITLLAIEMGDDQPNGIIGYHISNDETTAHIRQNLNEHVLQQKEYLIYIIGGNASSIGPNKLSGRISEAIQYEFKNYHIYDSQNLMDLNADNQHQYISVNLNVKGELTYCKHDK